MRQKFFNLRVKLLEHDLTQEEAAKIAGISPSAMVNRMSGKYPFDAWEMIYNAQEPDGKNVLALTVETVQRGPGYLTVEPKPVQGGSYYITVKTETVE